MNIDALLTDLEKGVKNNSISLGYALARAFMAGAENDDLRLADIQHRAHKTAVSKGWHETTPSFGEHIALIHSEASEALESYRKKEPYLWFAADGKPEGIAAEYADILIRICDYSEALSIPFLQAIPLKMAYNETRLHRHGGKVL